MFKNFNLDNETDHAQRFAEMISLLGPPPAEFLGRSEESLKFWDREGKSTFSCPLEICVPNSSIGNWRSNIQIPEQSLENLETRLEADNKMAFLRFLRKALHWLPEERPTARELLLDEWLRGDDY